MDLERTKWMNRMKNYLWLAPKIWRHWLQKSSKNRKLNRKPHITNTNKNVLQIIFMNKLKTTFDNKNDFLTSAFA